MGDNSTGNMRDLKVRKEPIILMICLHACIEGFQF
jgi:hypothetical protein